MTTRDEETFTHLARLAQETFLAIQDRTRAHFVLGQFTFLREGRESISVTTHNVSSNVAFGWKVHTADEDMPILDACLAELRDRVEAETHEPSAGIAYALVSTVAAGVHGFRVAGFEQPLQDAMNDLANVVRRVAGRAKTYTPKSGNSKADVQAKALAEEKRAKRAARRTT